MYWRLGGLKSAPAVGTIRLKTLAIPFTFAYLLSSSIGSKSITD
jgi:hypothetical protein